MLIINAFETMLKLKLRRVLELDLFKDNFYLFVFEAAF